jgi:selenide, water dikinase
MNEIRLTQFSPGAGCGCKISPKVLEGIIKTTGIQISYPALLVGNETSDDAAVYDLGNGTSVISTTDFFMPITDDAYDFGRIASANAISDVYAMGGYPLMAISILGWPVSKLPAELATQVIEGSRAICLEAGIPLAGGHSIDSLEPIFGLAVTGLVETNRIRRNNTARGGDIIFLTKPLGIGILSTAEKKGLLRDEHKHVARDLMLHLNKIGRDLSALEGITSVTDVTGFGLLGHLVEMCQGSNLQAVIRFHDVPMIHGIEEYIALGSIPGGTLRNFDSYGNKISSLEESQRSILCDPQTSGGLLIAVSPDALDPFYELTSHMGYQLNPIGYFEKKKEGTAIINVV